MIFRRLKTKTLLIVIFAVVVIEGVFLHLNIRSLSHQILSKTEEEAFNLSETIRLSIRNAMIMDRRDEYQRIIDLLFVDADQIQQVFTNILLNVRMLWLVMPVP